jgi:hypothetical protein
MKVNTYNVHPSKGQCPSVCINQTVIPKVETVKYLGMHFDLKQTWKERLAMKRKQLDHKTRDIKWLIGKKLPPITRKQNTHLQNNTQAYMDRPMAPNCGVAPANPI